MTRSNSIDAYTIKAELGRGGMGVVQLAHHPVFGQVALKRLHREATPFAQQSLRSEVRWLSRLRHRWVVRMLDHGEDRWGPWMAMQLVAGQPLSAYLRSVRHTASHPTEAHWTQRLAASSAV
ncbi:MAG: protein kinase, partial [Myxococcota bacterium]